MSYANSQTATIRAATGFRVRQLGRAVCELITRAATRLRQWHERSRQRRRLLELDDRLLRDIGLTRADVKREIEKPFWIT